MATPSGHAKLSPSAAKQWLNCTPSVQLSERYPDTGSDASAEGTTAHALSEQLIRFYLHATGPYTDPIAYTNMQNEIKAEIATIRQDKHYLADPVNMDRHCEDFKDFVIQQYHTALAETKASLIYQEVKVDLRQYVPEGFGTMDVGIVSEPVLRIIDLKYGKGVFVDVEDNDQMKIYAVGFIVFFADIYNIETVEMTIFQPRMDNISTWTISVKDLMEWAENYLKPRAKLAFEGKGEYVAGSHCRFCKAKAACRAKYDYEMGITEHMDKDVLNDNEIADIISRAKGLKEWLTAVEENALKGMLCGELNLPGYKVVEGRANRVYSDEAAVAKALIENGISAEKVFHPAKLRGITELEKLIGKTAFANYLKDLVIKPAGSPTLVEEKDKREKFSRSDPNEFAGYETEE